MRDTHMNEKIFVYGTSYEYDRLRVLYDQRPTVKGKC